ncbi:hypothetical protein T08_14208 [Trichinella sp. T8]|nr:hypothetical protein T08_14208 [Trichinella sp. T8]
MESTSYAIFLCTRHNVSGGCALRPVRMVSRGFARRRCVVTSLLKSRCDRAVELFLCNSLCSFQAPKPSAKHHSQRLTFFPLISPSINLQSVWVTVCR